MRPIRVLTAILLGLLVASGVSAQDDLTTLKRGFLENYANIVYAGYSDAHAGAVELQSAIAAFLEAPSEATFEAAKSVWLAAREPYTQTEAFRFYGGPIDDADGPEGLINAWPMDDVYVDYVDGQPNAGIINAVDAYPVIDADLLESLNEAGAEENISVGYHAIEFLLWGQDFSDDGPGTRPFTDYVDAPNAGRRADYLRVTADLLAGHLASLADAWNPDIADNYRAEFLALEPDAGLQLVFTGIGVLAKAELSGERMFTAYDNQDQEDEHSCFSDNTHRDIINNLQGIVNVYAGSYTRPDGTVISGPSLEAVIAAADATVAADLTALLSSAQAMALEIHTPFDQAIVLRDARPKVLETVMRLQDAGDKIAEASLALGIQINTALP